MIGIEEVLEETDDDPFKSMSEAQANHLKRRRVLAAQLRAAFLKGDRDLIRDLMKRQERLNYTPTHNELDERVSAFEVARAKGLPDNIFRKFLKQKKRKTSRHKRSKKKSTRHTRSKRKSTSRTRPIKYRQRKF